MLPKLLAWLSFATALLFAALALAGLFGGDALGDMVPTLILLVGLPLLVTERGLGLPDLAVLMGAYGVGDVLGNILASARLPRRPYRQMFAGYLWMGGFLIATTLATSLPLMDRSSVG